MTKEKTAPNEPEVKAQGFDKYADEVLGCKEYDTDSLAINIQKRNFREAHRQTWQAALSSQAACGEFEKLWDDSTSWTCGEKERCRLFFEAGQKFQAATLRLPDWLRYHACITGDCIHFVQYDCNQKLFDDIQDAVKSMNEGSGV